MVNLLKCLCGKKAQDEITFARIWSYSDLVFVKLFIIIKEEQNMITKEMKAELIAKYGRSEGKLFKYRGCEA